MPTTLTTPVTIETSMMPLSNKLTAQQQASITTWSHRGIFISNPSHFYDVVAYMIKDGAENTQVIADFDHTLSAYPSPSSHGILEVSPLLSEKYRSDASALHCYYYPIEMNHSLSEEEREKAMIEWWQSAHNLLKEQKVAFDIIQKSVQHAIQMGAFRLRSSFKEFVGTLASMEIPLLIFSAGLGNVIQALLAAHNIPLKNERKRNNNMEKSSNGNVDIVENIEIVSNWMKFDPITSTLGSFEDDLIHSLNKNYSHVKNQRNRQNSITASAHQRKNVILLGDSLTDIRMTQGLNDIQHILRIGYLNRVTSESLAVYKETYDVVLVDGDMEFPIDILRAIIDQKPL
jgi:5'-nucleotidase